MSRVPVNSRTSREGLFGLTSKPAATMNSAASLSPTSRILVLGHHGLVGSSFLRLLKQRDFCNVMVVSRREVDLRDQAACRSYFVKTRPEFVVLAAAKVGGIMANSTYPYDFIHDNLVIATNVVESCRLSEVKKTMLLGSTCIYPRMAPQPLQESALLSGPLEESNQWYAIAKISSILLGQAARRQHGMSVISAMPTNLYGPNDNFDPETSHVLPAMIGKFHRAKQEGSKSVTLWGTGSPRREFLHVDDLSQALLMLLSDYDEEEILNVGSGTDVSISELAQLVAAAVGFTGAIEFDPSKPDGTPRKQTDITRISKLGWKPTIALAQGISEVYQWYLENHTSRAATELIR